MCSSLYVFEITVLFLSILDEETIHRSIREHNKCYDIMPVLSVHSSIIKVIYSEGVSSNLYLCPLVNYMLCCC